MRAKQKNENKTCAKFDIYIAYREALQFYYSSRVCSIRHTCKGLHEILLAPLLLLLFRYRYRSRFTTFANARLLFVLTLGRRLLKKGMKEGKKTLKTKLYTFLKWVQYPNNLEKLNEIEMKWSEWQMMAMTVTAKEQAEGAWRWWRKSQVREYSSEQQNDTLCYVQIPEGQQNEIENCHKGSTNKKPTHTHTHSVPWIWVLAAFFRHFHFIQPTLNVWTSNAFQRCRWY